MLFEEASMPLEKLLERYSSGSKAMRTMRKKEEFQSPAIKAKADSEQGKKDNDQDADCLLEGSNDDKAKVVLDDVQVKLDNQLINGNSSEATAHTVDTQQLGKGDSVDKADSTDSSDKDVVEQLVTESLEAEKKPRTSAEAPSSTSNGVNKVTVESPPSEVSSSTEVDKADVKAEASAAGSSSSSVSCSSDTAGSSSRSSAEAGGSCTSSSSTGIAGSSSVDTAGGSGSSAGGSSSTDAGDCSSVSGSSQVCTLPTVILYSDVTLHHFRSFLPKILVPFALTCDSREESVNAALFLFI